VYDFTDRLPTPCECGAFEWDQLVIAEVCDFCSTGNARWEYRCKDFAAPRIPGLPMTQMSRGSWAACDPCHALIEANKRAKLAKRGAKTAPGKLRNEVVPLVRAMHDRFFANRIGEAIDHGG